ncbi:protein-L-isoaspartate(D-aspartate) O-methyltransferase [Uranotaenia lowii]|uniref:protein-L-isoaspartate(D-aspartate) O-methyltransferase n=1 Tax=Uranotaenia lowii TaxID=190385 RepID=UPI00247AE68F|nr:protein-L-isoaspartate(D-aspartate) O-methyltransferase [Uranotaenia lowii]
MAWRSRGLSNADLIRQLKEYGVIKSEAVAQALTATDRKFYVASNLNPYVDSPQRIGHGATISAPHMHAYALELLENHLKADSRVLDVGSGSGYLTACFARYIHAKENASGLVVGIEHHPELVKLGIKNIREDDASLIETGKVIMVEGDGRQGSKEHAPYDCIHVGAAAPETPTELINQLKPGGRMIIPVGPDGGTQYLEQYDKDSNGKVSNTRLMGVMYVPLTDLHT